MLSISNCQVETSFKLQQDILKTSYPPEDMTQGGLRLGSANTAAHASLHQYPQHVNTDTCNQSLRATSR